MPRGRFFVLNQVASIEASMVDIDARRAGVTPGLTLRAHGIRAAPDAAAGRIAKVRREGRDPAEVLPTVNQLYVGGGFGQPAPEEDVVVPLLVRAPSPLLRLRRLQHACASGG
jgi:hypothetical protein